MTFARVPFQGILAYTATTQLTLALAKNLTAHVTTQMASAWLKTHVSANLDTLDLSVNPTERLATVFCTTILQMFATEMAAALHKTIVIVILDTLVNGVKSPNRTHVLDFIIRRHVISNLTKEFASHKTHVSVDGHSLCQIANSQMLRVMELLPQIGKLSAAAAMASVATKMCVFVI